jgi:hypothetical protein
MIKCLTDCEVELKKYVLLTPLDMRRICARCCGAIDLNDSAIFCSVGGEMVLPSRSDRGNNKGCWGSAAAADGDDDDDDDEENASGNAISSTTLWLLSE